MNKRAIVAVVQVICLLSTIASAIWLAGCYRERDASAPRSDTDYRRQESILYLGRQHSMGEPGTFGAVTDLLPGDTTYLYVLDGVKRQVSVLPGRGSHEASGSMAVLQLGPFLDPVAMDLDPYGRLLVLDKSAAAVTTFEVYHGMADAVGKLSVPFVPSDLCVLNGNVFVMGYSDGFLVHQLSASGEISRSFAEAPAANPFLEEVSGIGYLLCDRTTSVVLPVSSVSPILRGFAESGEPRWETRLEGFHAQLFERIGKGYRVRVDESGKAHLAVGAFPMGGGFGVLQYKIFTRSLNGAAPPVIDTRIIRLDSGQEFGRQFDVPQLHALHGDRAYGSAIGPYPRVLVLTVDSLLLDRGGADDKQASKLH